ncbi:MAG: hypothetical protein WCJ39_06540 [bacterium]
MSYKEFTVNLLDFQSPLPFDMQGIADKISQLITALSANSGDYQNFILLLNQLKD